MRTDEEIKAIVEGAFAPLRVGVEIWDYQSKLRFRVFDTDDQPLIGFPKLVLAELRADTVLRGVIEETRERLTDRGIALKPWRFQ